MRFREVSRSALRVLSRYQSASHPLAGLEEILCGKGSQLQPVLLSSLSSQNARVPSGSHTGQTSKHSLVMGGSRFQGGPADSMWDTRLSHRGLSAIGGGRHIG